MFCTQFFTAFTIAILGLLFMFFGPSMKDICNLINKLRGLKKKCRNDVSRDDEDRINGIFDLGEKYSLDIKTIQMFINSNKNLSELKLDILMDELENRGDDRE